MRFKHIIFFLLACLSWHLAISGELTFEQRNRLDPVLRMVITHPELSFVPFLNPTGLARKHPDPRVNVFIKTRGPVSNLTMAGVRIQAIFDDIVTASVPFSQLQNLVQLDEVIYIEAAKPLEIKNDVSVPEIHAPEVRQQYGLTGKGVIIGIIDTGIDWRHEDFRKPDGTTRIKYLLDFSDPGDIDGDGDLDGPDAFGGTLYTEQEINNALRGIGTIYETDEVGHGTHVAGTAAGNGRGTGGGIPDGTYAGVAPEANLIIVKAIRTYGSINITDTDQLNATRFIDSTASILSQPYVINMSLGGHWGPHDGTGLSEQAVDKIVGPGKPGKIVVAAAGNEGTMNIHASGTLSTKTTSIETQFTIPSYMPEPGNYSDMVLFDIWYDGDGNLSVKLVTPSGSSYGPVASGKANDFLTSEGAISIDNASGGRNPNNNDKEILVFLVDHIASQPPASGTWKMILSGTKGRFDAWLATSTMNANITSNIDGSMLVSMPGTAQNAITVGAYITKDHWVNLDNQPLQVPNLIIGDAADFSSPGPTRDGRTKPEITAPGQEIASTYSSDAPPSSTFSMFHYGDPYPNAFILKDNKHAISQGTSMATPHVAGAVALMLQYNSKRDAPDIRNALISSARNDNFTGELPNDKWGYGKLDLLEAMKIAPVEPDETIPTEFKLLQSFPNPFSGETSKPLTIQFQVPFPGLVTLHIYNILGHRVRTLKKNATPSPSSNYVEWDGTDDSGQPLPSGLYFCRASFGETTRTIKIVLRR